MAQLSPFRATGRYGYACKVWIAGEIEQNYLGGVYSVWFSEQLNPLPPTGLSSAPLEIYRVVDYAVKTQDTDHPKIKDLRANIGTAINLFVAPTDPRLAKVLKRQIERAPLEMFRPQLWRIDLSNIETSRLLSGRPDWDEKRIEDLRSGEFELIVE